MRWAARTHAGHVRARNEDAWSVRPEAQVAAVADGVGGGPGGDRAALMAVDGAAARLAAVPWPDAEGRGRSETVQAIQRTILDEGDRLPALAGLATTLTAVRWLGRRLEGIHVGDSRAYLVDASGLVPLTHDHTPAGEALLRGEISREGLREHPEGHILLRALGGRGSRTSAPPHDPFEVEPVPAGNGILLCTDGIEAALGESTVEELVLPVLVDGDPEAALDRLFDAALGGPAPDNLTALLALPGA